MKFEILEQQPAGAWQRVLADCVFDNPALASQTAKRRAETTGRKHCIKKLAETDNSAWMVRERLRLALSEYQRLPWSRDILALISADNCRFPHASLKNNGKVAYTENAEKGASDIQSTMSPGRYLTQYHSEDFSSRKIAALSALCGDTSVSLLEASADIVQAYENGPRSCMSHSAADFNLDGTHPCAVYGGASDLKLMIFTREGDITARCLVWPEKLLYGTAYGDNVRLESELENLGYERGNFIGARLNRIPCGDNFICAYLDNDQDIDIASDFLIITPGGEACADETSGLLASGSVCGNCHERENDEHIYYSDGGDAYCSDCYHEIFTYCENCDNTVYSYDMVWIPSHDQSVCDNCANDFPECSHCQERHHENHITSKADGDIICDSCLENGAATLCCDCSEIHENDNVSPDDHGDPICHDCQPPSDPTPPTTTGSRTVVQPNQTEMPL